VKIAFIAMSGIRVCDQELLNLGLTLPGFVERSKVIASLPSLGLLTLAGMTPSRHHVSYFEVADLAESQRRGEIPDGFDIVAISSYTAQIEEAYALADLYRERGICVVLGGLHVTSLPDEALAHADAAVIGEGESCWPQLLEDAERGTLQCKYDGSNSEFDLAEAPMPSYELLDSDRYNRLTVQTSRGCPHLCDFCASSVLLTRKYKQKPIAKVLSEIDRIRDIWPHPFIEFADDNSLVNRAYWKELLPPLKARNLRWFAETDISVASDSDLLTSMRESGCAQVLIGLESPTLEPLRGIEMRADWKHRQWHAYKEAIRAIQSHGISVNGCFIIGLDAQGPHVFDDVLNFVDESGLHEVQITIQTAFPGTPLYDRLRGEGRLIEETAWRKCTLFDVGFRPKHMSAQELRMGFHKLAGRLYDDDSYRRRRERFKEFLKASHDGNAHDQRPLNEAQGGQV
jgi:radical SAM superfamily enzyme YgiQ (UPF0313 family)